MQKDQFELALARPAQKAAVTIETIRTQRTSAAAFSLACNVSGLEDKEIYLALDIDAGYFSNIKKGKATLQGDLVAKFCDVVGNTIYLEWLAFQIGCTLMMIKSEAERRAEAERELRVKAEEENRLLRSLLIGKSA
ncbi:transcriptional regulator [Herbaspirillum sp. ST 5-3]|uniref:transcriptional regulator n=1 Tax=Oxalobacteraceae TaxID=75682 RepID=UPI0010A36D24|nr:transcriptional regulator [Herbaspirillum sp. ST 5-3]